VKLTKKNYDDLKSGFFQGIARKSCSRPLVLPSLNLHKYYKMKAWVLFSGFSAIRLTDTDFNTLMSLSDELSFKIGDSSL